MERKAVFLATFAGSVEWNLQGPDWVRYEILVRNLKYRWWQALSIPKFKWIFTLFIFTLNYKMFMFPKIKMIWIDLNNISSKKDHFLVTNSSWRFSETSLAIFSNSRVVLSIMSWTPCVNLSSLTYLLSDR